MCVIFVADKVRPTREMLELGFKRNSHAIGIAWREVSKETGKVHVFWKKGNTFPLEEAIHMAEILPLPYVIHFRNPSNGTGQKDGCAHPFPIEQNVSLFLEGDMDGAVLFHNGMWGNWRNNLQEAVVRSRLQIPGEAWSDSRGLAWMAYNFGHGMLELIDEKVVAFGPNKIEIFGGKDWEKINGVLCSNNDWKPAGTSTQLPAHYAQQGHNRGHNHNHNRSVDHTQPRPTVETKANPGGGSQVTPFRGTTGAEAATGAAGGASGQTQQEAIQEARSRAVTQDRQASAWARSLNSKQFRRGEDVQADDIGFVRQKCAGKSCIKSSAFIKAEGKYYCMECWTEQFGFDKKILDIETKFYMSNKCEYCNDHQAIKVVKATKKWICGTCWHDEGRPEFSQCIKTGNEAKDKAAVNKVMGIEVRAVM